MTAISDGLSNIYSLTSQINSLKEQAKSGNADPSAGIDPKESILYMQQSFYDMLSKLISTNDDSDKEKESSDPFSFLSSSSQLSANLSGQLSASSSDSGSSLNQYSGILNNSQ